MAFSEQQSLFYKIDEDDMGKYGVVAVKAVNAFTIGKTSSIKDAWNTAAQEVFPNSQSSQVKGCPRGTFLGVCESGRIVGVPSGEYTKSKKNKLYGLKAVELLHNIPSLADDEIALWRQALEGQAKTPNHQMDVIASLWKAGLINSKR